MKSTYTLLMFSFLLASCSQIISPSKNTELTGVVQLARVSGATISVYELLSDGSKGVLLAQTVTDENGEYKVSLGDYRRHVMIESIGGKYLDEADIGNPNAQLKDAVPLTAITDAKFASKASITPMTDLAVKRTLELLTSHSSKEEAKDQALSEVAAVFGVKKEDIDAVPVAPQANALARDKVSNVSAVRAALALTAFSLVLKDLKEEDSNLSLSTVLEALKEDLKKDGKFDGKANGETNELAATLSLIWKDSLEAKKDAAKSDSRFVFKSGVSSEVISQASSTTVNTRGAFTGTLKGKRYKDGLLFSGLGTEALGEAGKMYKDGVFAQFLDGAISGKRYVDGVLAEGLQPDSKFYKLGMLAQFSDGAIDGKTYVDGALATGLQSDNQTYSGGVLANGEMDGIHYSSGKPSNRFLSGKCYVMGVDTLINGKGLCSVDGKYYRAGIESTCVDLNGEASFSGGIGSEADPYLICDAPDFNSIGASNLSSSFKLADNIDFGGLALTPIGTNGLSFNGVFDGNNFSLSNFNLNGTETRMGIIRSLGTTGQVKNLKVTSATITGSDRVGIIAGYSAGKLESIIVRDSSVTGTGDYVGGLVGLMEGNTTAILLQTYFEGDVVGVNHVGGIVGRIYFGALRKSVSEANVNASANNVGGMVGSYHDNHCAGDEFTDSISKATVSGVSYVGGAVGRAATGAPCTNRVISLASVTASGSFVGGFAGEIDNGSGQILFRWLQLALALVTVERFVV
ncbi:MAG: hypothetical protein EBQ85_05150 [Proteobacteria bacterium]|nr:hypothetical protein [Pseudomonadota bacterium]